MHIVEGSLTVGSMCKSYSQTLAELSACQAHNARDLRHVTFLCEMYFVQF